ncbi:MAG: rhomboid family intramembrane serine protease [Roseiflexaceae bacterium]|nr:rhomboid family intramembrane serine protease [Roseiflexaceae bacterium]
MFFLPVRDENPRKITPYVNWMLIILNLVVFGFQLLLGERFIIEWSFIAQRLTQFTAGEGDPQVLLTFFSAMFMHGSFGHIFGNMLFLWLFGDNVEEAYGHARYLVFYLICGIAATIAQYVTDLSSPIPNLGASGAISGVMGAYILMYARAKVQIFFFPFSIFFGNIGVPAWLMLGLWFLAQLTPALTTMGQISGGGVAYWAHVGGFVAGLIITIIVRPHCGREPRYHNAGLPRQTA